MDSRDNQIFLSDDSSKSFHKGFGMVIEIEGL